jgi:hypothetical protein
MLNFVNALALFEKFRAKAELFQKGIILFKFIIYRSSLT